MKLCFGSSAVPILKWNKQVFRKKMRRHFLICHWNRIHRAYGPYPLLRINSNLKVSCPRCKDFSRALALVSAEEVSDPHCVGWGGSAQPGSGKWTHGEFPEEAFLLGGWDWGAARPPRPEHRARIAMVPIAAGSSNQWGTLLSNERKIVLLLRLFVILFFYNLSSSRITSI